jgi:Exostosin family
MKVFLTTANYRDDCNPSGWLMSKSEEEDLICTKDPRAADAIIFVESHHGEDPYFRSVHKHPLFKKYRQKCVLYHDSDLSVTTIPTISPSIESWQYNPKHKRAFHYIARITENETIDQSSVNYDTKRDYLYSFMGSKTHSVRNKILDFNHPPDAYLKDTTGINAWELNNADKIDYEREYFDVINKSSFVLSPRGIGPCTYRLFEAMQLGRVPVIISDAWVKIPNIDWAKFAIIIPESDIASIPQILRDRKNEAVAMGLLAREYWEKYFSPTVSLQHIAIAAKDLLKHNYTFKDSLKDYSQFLRSAFHFRNFLRFKKNQLKRTLLSILQ